MFFLQVILIALMTGIHVSCWWCFFSEKKNIFSPRNYNTRSLHLVKIFEKLVPHILQFSPDGKLLAVGFTNGHCKLLKSTDLSEVGHFLSFTTCLGRMDGGENGWWEGMHQRNKHKQLTKARQPRT